MLVRVEMENSQIRNISEAEIFIFGFTVLRNL